MNNSGKYSISNICRQYIPSHTLDSIMPKLINNIVKALENTDNFTRYPLYIEQPEMFSRMIKIAKELEYDSIRIAERMKQDGYPIENNAVYSYIKEFGLPNKYRHGGYRYSAINKSCMTPARKKDLENLVAALHTVSFMNEYAGSRLLNDPPKLHRLIECMIKPYQKATSLKKIKPVPICPPSLRKLWIGMELRVSTPGDKINLIEIPEYRELLRDALIATDYRLYKAFEVLEDKGIPCSPKMLKRFAMLENIPLMKGDVLGRSRNSKPVNTDDAADEHEERDAYEGMTDRKEESAHLSLGI